MARSSTPAVVTFLVVTAFIASPHILQNYPQTAPLASALTWMGEKFMQGIASLTFAVAVMTFCVLVSDAREWLTGVSATEISPTPEALEEGTAPKFQHELDVLEAEVAGADPPTLPEPVRITIIGKIFSLVANTLFFVYAFSKEELAPPLPENATIFALFILRGLEVLFVILLILIAMVCLWPGVRARTPFRINTAARAPVAPAPTEILFDETATVAEPAVMKEKQDLTGEANA